MLAVLSTGLVMVRFRVFDVTVGHQYGLRRHAVHIPLIIERLECFWAKMVSVHV